MWNKICLGAEKTDSFSISIEQCVNTVHVTHASATRGELLNGNVQIWWWYIHTYKVSSRRGSRIQAALWSNQGTPVSENVTSELWNLQRFPPERFSPQETFATQWMVQLHGASNVSKLMRVGAFLGWKLSGSDVLLLRILGRPLAPSRAANLTHNAIFVVIVVRSTRLTLPHPKYGPTAKARTSGVPF